MANKEQVTKIVLDSIETLNKRLSENRKLPVSNDAIFLGQTGSLSSLELVSLVVMVEEKLSQEFHIGINLADERAMSQLRSPFKTAQTLINYIHQVLEEKNA